MASGSKNFRATANLLSPHQVFASFVAVIAGLAVWLQSSSPVVAPGGAVSLFRTRP